MGVYTTPLSFWCLELEEVEVGNGWGAALAFAVGRRLRFFVSCSSAGFFFAASCSALLGADVLHPRFIEEFHRFFAAFSVRPGISLAISVHLFPFDTWSSLSVASSSWKERKRRGKKRRGRRKEEGRKKVGRKEGRYGTI